MTDFFRRDLSNARFEEVDFSHTWFRNVYFVDATLRGAWFEDVDIDGEIRNLRINGVDIGPLVETELDRRHPERTKLRPTDADGYREAWAVVEQAWPATIERARRLAPELLHARVRDEWSFIETLRHLLFATDAWILRAFLGRSDPYTPLDLPHSEMEPDPALPNDPDARPSLDEVLELRAERMAITRTAIAGLTDDVLAGETEPIPAPGYPEAGTYRVSRCLNAVLNEEWLHRLYAERDLAVLEAAGVKPVAAPTQTSAAPGESVG